MVYMINLGVQAEWFFLLFSLSIWLVLILKQREQTPPANPCQASVGQTSEWVKSYFISVKIPLQELNSVCLWSFATHFNRSVAFC